MRCPKCKCEIRIQTDVCPFCGLVLPEETKNAYDGAIPDSTLYNSASQITNSGTQCLSNAANYRSFGRKNVRIKRRAAGRGRKSDDLTWSKRSELNQEIAIFLLFVLIIINMVEVIVLLGLQ